VNEVENEETSPTKPVGEETQSEAMETLEIDEVVALTADLQRLQAEYANYRKRVERDRELTRELAVAAVLTELIPILDDLERARGHGELEGGFKAGVPFDPAIHEALMHSVSEDVDTITAIEILQPGYRLRDRTLRPARVAVADPA
jgi:molecular chaperone GrpE